MSELAQRSHLLYCGLAMPNLYYLQDKKTGVRGIILYEEEDILYLGTPEGKIWVKYSDWEEFRKFLATIKPTLKKIIIDMAKLLK